MNLQATPAKPAGSRERSLDEVKAEFMRRAGRLNPFEDIRREDAERVMHALQNLDKDHWAQEWSKIGLGYEEKGDARAKAGAPGAELAEPHMHAFDACRVGRYPTPNCWENFRRTRIAAHVRKGAIFRSRHGDHRAAVRRRQKAHRLFEFAHGVNKPPVVLHWGGVDGWKEIDLRIATAVMDAGLAFADHRHAGQRRDPAPSRRSLAERTFLTRLDYLPRRGEIDGGQGRRLGGSFGAYWAARLALHAADRIKGVDFSRRHVHYGFRRNGWPAFTTGGATYLFGAHSLLEARGRAMGTNTLEDFWKPRRACR